VIGGPIWSGPIHDPEFVAQLKETVKANRKNFRTSKRLIGILEGIEIENQLGNIPLSINFQMICSELKSTNLPKKKILKAIQSLGFKAVQTYYDP